MYRFVLWIGVIPFFLQASDYNPPRFVEGKEVPRIRRFDSMPSLTDMVPPQLPSPSRPVPRRTHTPLETLMDHLAIVATASGAVFVSWIAAHMMEEGISVIREQREKNRINRMTKQFNERMEIAHSMARHYDESIKEGSRALSAVNGLSLAQLQLLAESEANTESASRYFRDKYQDALKEQ